MKKPIERKSIENITGSERTQVCSFHIRLLSARLLCSRCCSRRETQQRISQQEPLPCGVRILGQGIGNKISAYVKRKACPMVISVWGKITEGRQDGHVQFEIARLGKLTLKLEPEGGKGESCVNIWASLFQAKEW